jgi:hypothetical protein
VGRRTPGEKEALWTSAERESVERAGGGLGGCREECTRSFAEAVNEKCQFVFMIICASHELDFSSPICDKVA